MAKLHVELAREKATMLATLYGRAIDARQPHPILDDTMAISAVEQLDYDFSKTAVSPSLAASVVVRAKHFDRWTTDFLAEHEQASVVHLGAGLDTRVWRVDPGPAVRWWDVDYPEVVALREKVYPTRQGYAMIGCSVTDPGWLAEIPSTGPVLVIAEGLTMYLSRDQGHELFQRITEHFAFGVVAFDSQNRVAVRLQRSNPVVRTTGSTLRWGIDDPAELEWAVPGLHCVDAVNALYAPGAEELPRSSRIVATLVRPVRPLRTLSMYLRYTF